MDSLSLALLLVSCMFSLVALIFLATAIKIVPEYRRLLVFRLGRCIGPRGPGLVILLPFVDRGVPVDLREQDRQASLRAITQDRAPVSLELAWTFQIVDPEASVIQVHNLETATDNLLHTHWQTLAGQMTRADLPLRQAEIEDTLHTQLDETSRRWGVKVTGLKIRELKC